MRSETFVDILKDIAQIFFATLVVNFWTNNQIDTPTMFMGFFISFLFWLFSLLIAYNLKLNKV
jgi:hypothetical protein